MGCCSLLVLILTGFYHERTELTEQKRQLTQLSQIGIYTAYD
jgi:hypothetical protein